MLCSMYNMLSTRKGFYPFQWGGDWGTMCLSAYFFFNFVQKWRDLVQFYTVHCFNS